MWVRALFGKISGSLLNSSSCAPNAIPSTPSSGLKTNTFHTLQIRLSDVGGVWIFLAASIGLGALWNLLLWLLGPMAVLWCGSSLGLGAVKDPAGGGSLGIGPEARGSTALLEGVGNGLNLGQVRLLCSWPDPRSSC